jgi:hypothetical protein
VAAGSSSTERLPARNEALPPRPRTPVTAPACTSCREGINPCIKRVGQALNAVIGSPALRKVTALTALRSPAIEEIPMHNHRRMRLSIAASIGLVTALALAAVVATSVVATVRPRRRSRIGRSLSSSARMPAGAPTSSPAPSRTPLQTILTARYPS